MTCVESDLPEADGTPTATVALSTPGRSAAATVPRVEDGRLLVVTYGSAERWRWLLADAGRAHVVDVAPEGDPDGLPDDTIRTPVRAEADAVGLALYDALLAADTSDRRVVVCFDSLSALCEHASLPEAFRFVHLLAKRFRTARAEVQSVFYLDPSAHDPETVETLSVLFDERLG